LVLIHRPWRLETLIRRMVFVMACFYAGVLLTAWADQMADSAARTSAVERMIITTVSFQGAALILIWRFLRGQHLTWREAFGFSNDWAQAVLLGLLVACICVPIGWWWLRDLYPAIMKHV